MHSTERLVACIFAMLLFCSLAYPQETTNATPLANPVVTGNGVAGYVPVWSSASNLIDSVMFQRNGLIGIGTTSPTSKLFVESSSSQPAIRGQNSGTAGFSHGVAGFTSSASGAGVAGTNTNGGTGVFGSGGATGVYGVAFSTKGIGVYGIAATGGPGVYGAGGVGTNEVFGGDGGQFLGGSNSSYLEELAGAGVTARGGAGITSGDGIDAYGGDALLDGMGGVGIVAEGGVNSDGSRTYAGFFNGDVSVNGNLSKSSGSFKIDHPVDPANKYLYHSFVESPDMKNIYDGNVTTDARGLATVMLPDWFEALNRDFRYQLTVIGQFAQAIVASKIASNQFTIRTDKPHVEVSWQVTGTRHDVWANAHRIPVEEEKPAREQGYFLHPELYNQSPERSVVYATHPNLMRKLAELRNPQ